MLVRGNGMSTFPITEEATQYVHEGRRRPGFADAYLEIRVDLEHFQENSNNKLSVNKVIYCAN